jgi:hypothetical protein
MPAVAITRMNTDSMRDRRERAGIIVPVDSGESPW